MNRTCASLNASLATSRGFTLVELVITILIIGILTASAAPKFAESLRRTQLDAACQRVKADLNLARQNAISKSSIQAVQFTVGAGTYTLPGMQDLDSPTRGYSIKLAASPYEATIVSASLGNDSEVRFDQYGQPDSGGVVTLRRGSIQGTVTISADTGLASVP